MPSGGAEAGLSTGSELEKSGVPAQIAATAISDKTARITWHLNMHDHLFFH
jgi:hypothetical protein